MYRLLILLLLSNGLAAQTIYFEDFDSGAPDILALIDNDGLTNSSGSTETWQYSPRLRGFANASMIAPTNFALRSITDPSPAISGQQSEDWVQLPKLSIPANAKLIFKFQAESNVSSWTGYPNLEIRISTTDSNLSSYSTFYTITDSPSWFVNQHFDLNAYAGQDIYIALVNTAYNNPGWGSKRIFIDDIFVGTLPDYDLEAFSYKSADFAKTSEPYDLQMSLLNLGEQTLTSLDIHYQVSGSSIETASISGLNASTLDTMYLIHPVPWAPSAPGTYTVRLWADNINGNPDVNPFNDTITLQMDVFDDVTVKKPLLEIFGGADCGACAPLAEDLDRFTDAWEFNANSGSISCIEYQTFPNDPSNNSDGQIRDTFYSVTGYPDEQLWEVSDYKDILLDDGFKTFKPFFNYSESPLSSYPAFVDIDVSAFTSGNTIHVDVEINPLVDFPESDIVLHIAVCEKEYTFTGGSTSQTVFKQVMRKMLPDAYGSLIGPMSQGSPINISESYTFTIGGVADGSYNLWTNMQNLEVVAFLQVESTREILQSASISSQDITGITDLDTPMPQLYPNPATSNTQIIVEAGTSGNVELISLSGKLLKKINITPSATQVEIDLSNLSGGVYLVRFSDENGKSQTSQLVVY